MRAQASKTNSRSAAALETRFRILESGEQVFAAEGFAGASMRAIAEEAEVAQGLLHYHFDNKQKLFGAIVGWRAAIINEERCSLLQLSSPDASLIEILNALFRPALGNWAGGEAYGRIMSSLTTGDRMYQALVKEHYDPTARLFINALHNAVPGLSMRQASWGYSLAIHVLVAGMARTGRIERLADEGAPASTETFLKQLVGFASGGIQQLASSKGDEI